MTRTKQDSFGIAVGAVLGGLVGIALAYPAIPRDTSLLLAGVELGRTETFLLVGALAIVSVPVLFVVLMTLVRS